MYPVLEIITELKEKLRSNKIVILQAPPGAGKSTVLPLELLNEQWLDNQKIIMLEPRRLAARSVAMRLAYLKNEEAGNTIGYQVRFENVTHERTRIHVLTEGILTRKIQTDNSLEGIGLIIFDEFHERSLQADLALALCLQVQQVLRPDLKILIMSATLDGDKLSSQLQAPLITSLGKQYPIVVHYSNLDATLSIAANTARKVRQALKETSGDILVFLPGAGEIHQTEELLASEPLAVQPLYGELPFQEQQKAIVPHPQGLRKVVLATSIAETSLTIEGITTVIDTGFARIPRFDPRSGLTRLETVRVTQDAATQRAGRAGRLGPGICYRLWAEGAHHHLLPSRKPEILEADLATLVLEIANWGIDDANELAWITPPPKGSFLQAKELLQSLDALRDNKITEHGRQLLKLPTHPRLAHMLLKADSTALATDIASLIEERDPLPKESGADLSLRVEVLRKWRRGEKVNADKNILQRIERLATSWRRAFKITADNSIVSDTEVGRLLMEAYPERIAQQIDKQGYRYKLVNGRVAKLPENDLLHKEHWLCVAQLDAGEKEGKLFSAAPLSLADVLSKSIVYESVKWDNERGLVVGTLEERIGSLLVSSKPLPKISDEKRIEVLLDALQKEGLNLIGWGDAEKEWQARVVSISYWRPTEGWPKVEDEQLLATAHDWLAPFLTTIAKRSELQRLDLQAIVQTILPWELNARLQALAPSHLKVPSGSFIKIRYDKHGSTPIVEVRLQEMFGLLETPSINEGKTKVMLHLLSPGYKPVQVTQDLKSFWQSTYHQVRKELRIRYPKHHWPEDPWTAEAVKGVIRKK
jgi:ATP-dependent helicase HrpB